MKCLSIEQKNAIINGAMNQVGQPKTSKPEQEPEDIFRVPVEVEPGEQPSEHREAAPEIQPEREVRPEHPSRERVEAEPPPTVAPPQAAAPQPAAAAKHPDVIAVERILEENLEEIYQRLPAQKQAEFRVKGEETASKIVLLLQQAKLKVKHILDLIRDWLKLIPGVNKFFLEQEAKIKADKLLAWREAQRRRGA